MNIGPEEGPGHDTSDMGPVGGGRDLPDTPENVTAYLFGFYVGFVTWRFAIPGEAKVGKSGWFYIGYIMGWMTKMAVIVWFAQTALPDVGPLVQPAATGVAAVGTALFVLLKFKLFGGQ